jgi:hypothetical protein
VYLRKKFFLEQFFFCSAGRSGGLLSSVRHHARGHDGVGLLHRAQEEAGGPGRGEAGQAVQEEPGGQVSILSISVGRNL